MLSGLLDRLVPVTGFYLLALWATWQLQYITSALPAFVVAFLATVWMLTTSIYHVRMERRIDALGGHAPAIETWSPGNFLLLIEAVRKVLQHRNHEWWWNNFAQVASTSNPTPWTFEAVTIGQRVLLTADEENIKAILATQFHDFGKGEEFRKYWKDFLGYSIFTTDGELWHNSRQLLRPQFVKDRVSDLHTFEKHIQPLLSHLAGTHDGATIKIDDLFFRFALDAATDFLLGSSVESLSNPQVRFADAFAHVQYIQSIIARAGPLASLVPKKEQKKQLKIIDEFINQFIEQALQLSPEELEKKSKSDEGYTFLHAIASYTRDRKVLRDQLIAVLLAGRDTTASMLSWLFYELSRKPEVVEKLRKEIISYVGSDRSPTYADLKSMRYLQHALNEVMRMYPAVPFNVRISLKDTTLPRGGGPDGTQPIGVPEGTPVGYSPLILHRRADIYPPTSETFPDPDTFVPERWDHWTPKSWTYIPFNGGPRICIGQQFALAEMAYTVVRIFQTFQRLECRTPEFPMLRSEIVIQPAHGVYVAFHKGGKAQQ
ncbi:putative P450 monooxygenase [Polychaeton citri CBS 116435]|uniref:P450 monooxygenase n=1 Tax=Polychaeton citri CBS 116435 TaxID=1314669 RepID=A0A9P4QGB8_9PEZI|nr:putative P450 monooxygenase [Polychaeton citri CBS 116435]